MGEDSAALLPDLHAVDSWGVGPFIPDFIGHDPCLRDAESLFGGVDHYLAPVAILPVGQRERDHARAGQFPSGILVVVQFDGTAVRDLKSYCFKPAFVFMAKGWLSSGLIQGVYFTGTVDKTDFFCTILSISSGDSHSPSVLQSI